MKLGLDALYVQKDAPAAVAHFRGVLARNANHYGATYQLAMALDTANQRDEARPIWSRACSRSPRQPAISAPPTKPARASTSPNRERRTASHRNLGSSVRFESAIGAIHSRAIVMSLLLPPRSIVTTTLEP